MSFRLTAAPLVLLACCVLVMPAAADMQMLGLGGGGGNGMVKGSSFNLDTKERITRVHGSGVKVDLELLEVAAAGGSILYTPTHVEFKKGLTRWMQTFSDGKLSLHHNDKTVLQLYTPDESPYYLLSMRGNAAFRDLILDRALSNAVAFTLCIVDSVFDDSLTQASCEVRAESVHLTVSQSMEALAKSLLYVSEFVSSAQKNILADLTSSVKASLVAPLQLEVRSALDEVRGEVSGLQLAMQSEREALTASLSASEAAVNSTLAALLGDVAEATTVTLAAISSEAHSNLTKLEKAVFLHFVEFNKTYGQLLDVTVLQLESNLTRLAEEVAGGLRELRTETLPSLHATITADTQAAREAALASFGAENLANTTQLFEAVMNFSLALQVNVTVEQTARQQQEERLHGLGEELTAGLAEAATRREVLEEALGEAVGASNATAAALQGDIDSVLGAVRALAGNHSALLQRQNETAQQLAANLTISVEQVRIEAKQQAGVVEEALGAAMEALQGQVAGNASELRAGLELAREQLLQVEQNSSHSLAKSNSILAGAVGEVNQSLSLLGVATGQSLARLQTNFSLGMDAILVTLNESVANASSHARRDLLLASDRLSERVEGAAESLGGRLQELNASLTSDVDILGVALRQEVEQLESRQLQALGTAVHEGEANLTSRLDELQSSLGMDLQHLTEHVGEQIQDLNASSQHSFMNLTSNMTSMFARMQQLVVDMAREVYSPLEVDELHPDSRPEPPEPGGSADDDRFQRIDRLKRNKNKKTTAPRPVHFLHEELRVEVHQDLLDLLEHEHGGSLSRSAVIEKGLHTLQQELRRQGAGFQEQLLAADANHSAALLQGLQLRDHQLGNATQSLMAGLLALNASLELASETTDQGLNQQSARLQALNESLSISLRQQTAEQRGDLSSLQQKAADNVTALRTALMNLQDEAHRNNSESHEQLEGGLNHTTERLNLLAVSTDQRLADATAALSTALAAESASLNSSAMLMGERLRAEAQAWQLSSLTNASELERRVEALNSSSWKEHVETRRQATEEGTRTTASLLELAGNISTATQQQQTMVRQLEEAAARNLSDLRQSLVVAARLSNTSQEALGRDLATLSDQLSDLAVEQTKRWTASDAVLEAAVQAAAARVAEVNDSLSAQLSASSSALAAALVRANTSQANMAAENHAAALRMIEVSSASATAAIDAASKQSSADVQAIAASVEALRAVASQNSSLAEASWTRLVKTSQEETAAQCSTALTTSSDSLRAEVHAAQSRMQEDMTALSSEVQGSLRASLQSTSQQLELFSARATGRANLTDHRVAEAESRLGAAEAAVQQTQSDLQAAMGEAEYLRKEVVRLEEGQVAQASRLWSVMNASAASSVRMSELSFAAAGASQLLDVLDESVRGLALNCSAQAGLLQGALLQGSEERAAGNRQLSAMEARLVALDEKVARSQEVVGAVQLQMGGASGSLPDLQQEVVRVEGRMDVTSEAVRGLQGQVMEVQAAAKQVQGDAAGLQRRLDEVTGATLPALTAGLAEVTASSEKGLERQAAQHQHLVEKTLAAAEEKAVKMEQRLAVVELLVTQQEARIEALARENEALKRSTAAQESVDDLRRLLQELQASMLQQSSKVLDLIVANLAAGGGSK